MFFTGNYGARPPGLPYQGYPPPNSNGPPQQYSPRGMQMHHGPPHQFPPYQVSFKWVKISFYVFNNIITNI